MSLDDAINCPNPNHDDQKLSVSQGAPFIHEGVLCYWRRKKCPICGFMTKTVEVPAERLTGFHATPTSREMS